MLNDKFMFSLEIASGLTPMALDRLLQSPFETFLMQIKLQLYEELNELFLRFFKIPSTADFIHEFNSMEIICGDDSHFSCMKCTHLTHLPMATIYSCGGKFLWR